MHATAEARRRALGTLGVLTAINLLNYVDRYLVPPLVPELERAMQLSQAQVGWLWPAFMIVYMIAAPIFGSFGDRGSRPRAIALGVAIWSVATALTGLAQTFGQLYAARALVGVGEAACVAIAPALLADCFPVAARGRVYAVLNMAIPVGAALGYVLGGLLGHQFGWRSAFLVCGLPGIALAAVAMRLPDPPRGAMEAHAPRHLPAATAAGGRAANGGARAWLGVYARLLRRGPYLVLVAGYAAYTFALGGLGFWMPAFLEKVRGLPPSTATMGFGAVVVVTGFAGTLAGGFLGDRWQRRTARGYLWFAAVTTLGAVPFALVALTSTSPPAYMAAIVLAELLLFMSTGPVNAAIANSVTPLERASAMALSMLAIHAFGDVPSPPLIGYLADAGTLARAVLVVPVAVLAGGLIWLGAALAPSPRRAAGA